MNDATNGQPRQRWQLLFARSPPALRMRQADMVDEFERVFKEAGLPLAYSNAQKPRPRLKLAANPPVGIELQGRGHRRLVRRARSRREDQRRRRAAD